MIRKAFGLSWIALAILGTTCTPSAAQTPTVIQIDIEKEHRGPFCTISQNEGRANSSCAAHLINL
jgi:hypothetical protein